jgi:hypothetical protein
VKRLFLLLLLLSHSAFAEKSEFVELTIALNWQGAQGAKCTLWTDPIAEGQSGQGQYGPYCTLTLRRDEYDFCALTSITKNRSKVGTSTQCEARLRSDSISVFGGIMNTNEELLCVFSCKVIEDNNNDK